MKAKLRHIVIDVKEVKVGFVVLIDELFGVITDITSDSGVVTFYDGSTEEYELQDLKKNVVKFIAMMKDLQSYSIIHGDFRAIMDYFPDKETYRRYLEKGNISVVGRIKKIATYPKVDDIVEVVDMNTIRNNIIDHTDRANLVGKVVEVTKNRFTIVMASTTKVLNLKRATFNILSDTNSKEVFELYKESDESKTA